MLKMDDTSGHASSPALTALLPLAESNVAMLAVPNSKLCRASRSGARPGGPAGGNGGNGGAVWAVADGALNSLTPFRKQLHYRATPGQNGGGSSCHGSNGAELEVRVSGPGLLGCQLLML